MARTPIHEKIDPRIMGKSFGDQIDDTAFGNYYNNTNWYINPNLESKYFYYDVSDGNPCPTGWTIPTETEIRSAVNNIFSKTIHNDLDIDSFLKMPLAGYYLNQKINQPGF